MTRRLLLLAALALLAGCESDEAKLERLQEEATDARGMVLYYEQEIEAVPIEELPDEERYARVMGKSASDDDLLIERALQKRAGGPREASTPATARYDSIHALLQDARTRATLAQRELDRFLR